MLFSKLLIILSLSMRFYEEFLSKKFSRIVSLEELLSKNISEILFPEEYLKELLTNNFSSSLKKASRKLRRRDYCRLVAIILSI